VLKRLLRFWFTFEGPVGRRAYFFHGAALMALKYLTDAAIIWATTGALWLPGDYLTTGTALEHSKLAQGPTFLPLLLGMWTVPFLWIGVTLTSRRLRDARLSAWYSVLFVVPLLNYVAMAILCLLPTDAIEPAPVITESRPVRGDKLKGQLAGIAAGAATGFLLVSLGIFLLRTYGVALFVGTPFVMGAVTGFVYNRIYSASSGETLLVVIGALVAVGAALVAFAVEGAVCLVMALPLAIAFSWFGSLMGRNIAQQELGEPMRMGLVILLVPLATPIVDSRTPILTREVRTVVEIDAAPDVVWRNVVAFPRISSPGSLMFRLGIAAPIGARIEGEGVGALRYCEFTTGDFVEPVTAWEPGKRLAFDITSQPAPMRELSPYRIKPPHLDDWFRATRGEFRLEPLPGGRTRVVGSTWYELDIHPAPYFAVYADFIVEHIHRRVLDHIAAVSVASR
jgi:uncharacterized membrane protein YhaH (DUF805 family)